MTTSVLLSDNGASSGSAGLKTTGGNDGTLVLQTTTAGGTATTAMTIDTSQNVGIGTTTMTRNTNIGGSSAAVGLSLQNSGTSGRSYSIFSTNNGAAAVGALGFYDDTAGAYRMVIDSSGNLQFNSGYGSVATAYGCRAWVNFNGTGTVTIRASGNVSSITDNGTGDYTVNFTNAMPDANYSVVASSRQLTASGYLSVATDVGTGGSNLTRTTSAYQIQMANVVGGLNDNPWQSVAIFR